MNLKGVVITVGQGWPEPWGGVTVGGLRINNLLGTSKFSAETIPKYTTTDCQHLPREAARTSRVERRGGYRNFDPGHEKQGVAQRGRGM